MANEDDTVQIHLAAERRAGAVIELPERFDVLQQEPSACVVLIADAAVDEVHVDGREDVSAAGEELSEIAVSGIGKSFMSWLPCTISTSGKGPGPSGYQT